MKKMPYRATTATGEVFDIEFPLHPHTASAVCVQQLLQALLASLSREIAILPKVANGDVLQAIAMAMAVRAGIIHAPQALLDEQARGLLDVALQAMTQAVRVGPAAGHA